MCAVREIFRTAQQGDKGNSKYGRRLIVPKKSINYPRHVHLQECAILARYVRRTRRNGNTADKGYIVARLAKLTEVVVVVVLAGL